MLEAVLLLTDMGQEKSMEIQLRKVQLWKMNAGQ